MVTAVIVEDDVRDAELLQRTVLELQPDLVFVLCQSGEEALEYLKGDEKKADIFFLDRELLGMDGFALAERIRLDEKYEFTPIVFVTGYEMGQLHAYQKYHCFYYILKPYNKEFVAEKIGPLLRHIDEKKEIAPMRKVVYLQTKERESFVYADDILYLETRGRGCLVYTVKNKYDVPRKSLEKMMDEINETYLIRCHKSFAVNLKNVIYIKKISRNLWRPVFRNTEEMGCEIGKTYYESVMEQYQKFLRIDQRVDNDD